MNCDKQLTKLLRSIFLILAIILIAAQGLHAGELYDDFNNPPNSARPFVRWTWPEKMTEKEVNQQLDIFQQTGFGGVEITPVQNTSAKMLKFAANAAKQRGMLVDLSLGPSFSAPFIKSGEQIQIIALGKKTLKGPASFSAKVKDLISVADQAADIQPDKNAKLMFLRLIQMDLLRFKPGEELIEKIRPDGTVAIDINDSNDYTLYIGVRHENFVKPAGKQAVLDPFNKGAVEKYLNNISAKFGPKLGDYVHAISCDALQLSGANWTADFNEQFLKRRGYNVTPYLPAIIDSNFPYARNRFYETVRRTRYDYCLTLAELFSERFVRTFTGFCRDNGVLSRLGPAMYPSMLDIYNDFNLPDIPAGSEPITPDKFKHPPNLVAEINSRAMNKIASSAVHLYGKTVISCLSYDSSQNKTVDDLSFISGVNHFIFDVPDYRFTGKKFFDKYARLSYLFQSSQHQAKIAILLPINDIWSDCGPSRARLADYNWYLFPLWQALNNNGYCADYISEKILQQAAYADGKLHCGPLTYDLVILPDAVSVEFESVRILRFYASAGGKIAIIGQRPETAPGYKDLVKRGVPVAITMDFIRQNDPNRVVFVKAPVSDRNDLVGWTADLLSFLKVPPAVKISPVNPNLFFAHYLAADSTPSASSPQDDRDIFFFVNTNNTAPISFLAQFNTDDKTPWIWDPETGNRSMFPYGGKKDRLDIELEPLDSILLVFEPNMPESPPAPKAKFDL